MTSEQYYKHAKHKAWRAEVIRRAGGLCEVCKRYGRTDKDGLPIVATVAHHIKPRKEYPALQYVISNGRALCDACHAAAHPEKGAKSHKGMYCDK